MAKHKGVLSKKSTRRGQNGEMHGNEKTRKPENRENRENRENQKTEKTRKPRKREKRENKGETPYIPGQVSEAGDKMMEDDSQRDT